MTLPVNIHVNKSLSSWFSGQTNQSVENDILEHFLPTENLDSFINPSLKLLHDPSLFKDMDSAVERISRSIKNKEKIVILGDYDVDGITASALLIRFFNFLDFQSLQLFIPNRFQHGYGLTSASVQEVKKLNPNLVITVDNGITAIEETEQLKKEGIDVIITDHHTILNHQIPDCLVINPKQSDCQFPDKNLSGVGVAYFLLIALRRNLRNQGFWENPQEEPNLVEDLDLVTLGTLADQVPLTDTNRLLSKIGLRVINSAIQTPNGLTKYSYLHSFAKKSGNTEIDSETIAFQLAPLLNSAGRMQDAALGVEYLISNRAEHAQKVYGILAGLNKARKEKGQMMFELSIEAYETKKTPAVLINHHDFHEGIIGIVASRMVETYQLPAIIFAPAENNTWKGSGRSIPGINILNILDSCSEYLQRYGGHSQAAGCTINDENIESFKNVFYSSCQSQLERLPAYVYQADMELDIRMLSRKLHQTMKVLEPFGQSNPRPVFYLSNLELGYPKVIGEKHFKWEWNAEVEFVYWNAPEELYTDRQLNLAFELSENCFRGKRKLLLNIKAATISNL